MDIPNACVVEMPIHKGPVLSVRFNHSGDYCLSCGADRVVKLINPHKGLLIKTYRCHFRSIMKLHRPLTLLAVATRRMCEQPWPRTTILGLQVVATTAFQWCAQTTACCSQAPCKTFAGLGCWYWASYSSFKGVWYEGQFAAVCTRQHSADRRQRRPQREDLHAMCSTAPNVM